MDALQDVVVYCAESPDFDINVRDNAGYTPLHEACNRGHLDIAQVSVAAVFSWFMMPVQMWHFAVNDSKKAFHFKMVLHDPVAVVH